MRSEADGALWFLYLRIETKRKDESTREAKQMGVLASFGVPFPWRSFPLASLALAVPCRSLPFLAVPCRPLPSLAVPCRPLPSLVVLSLVVPCRPLPSLREKRDRLASLAFKESMRSEADGRLGVALRRFAWFQRNHTFARTGIDVRDKRLCVALLGFKETTALRRFQRNQTFAWFQKKHTFAWFQRNQTFAWFQRNHKTNLGDGSFRF